MSISVRTALLCAAAALFTAPALAQSSYQCVRGELLGGPQGFACETDTQGRIVNVKPRALTETAPQTRSVPAPQASPTGTTVYRGTTGTHIPHQPAPRQYTTPRTTTSTTTRTYTYTQQPTPRTYTYRSQPTPAPVQQTQTFARSPVHPILYICNETVARLRDTRDGRRQYEVCYSDLRPLDDRSAEILFDRVSSAARKACRAQITGSLIRGDRRCRRDAIEQAVFDVNSPALDAVYSDETGRAIPRVRVGRPIYR